MSDSPTIQQVAGNVGRKPEAKPHPRDDGAEIVEFSLAVTRKYDREDPNATQWLSVAVFNEDIQKQVLDQIKVGDKVVVEGKIKPREYNGKMYYNMQASRVGKVSWFVRSKNDSFVPREKPADSLPSW